MEFAARLNINFWQIEKTKNTVLSIFWLGSGVLKHGKSARFFGTPLNSSNMINLRAREYGVKWKMDFIINRKWFHDEFIFVFEVITIKDKGLFNLIMYLYLWCISLSLSAHMGEKREKGTRIEVAVFPPPTPVAVFPVWEGGAGAVDGFEGGAAEVASPVYKYTPEINTKNRFLVDFFVQILQRYDPAPLTLDFI